MVDVKSLHEGGILQAHDAAERRPEGGCRAFQALDVLNEWRHVF